MNSKKNRIDIILNIFQQLVTLIIPLITMPYLAKILGATGIGIYAYTDSIVQYFVLFGVLGLTVYGTRQIAYVRDSKRELADTFWSILALRIVSTFLALCAYYLFVIVFTRQYRAAFLIQSIVILTNMIDISWLYIGIGDFKKTVLRSISIKIIGLLAIFLFIKEPTDYCLYILLIALINFLGNASLWTYLPKTVSRSKLSFSSVIKHLKPTLMLFLPEIAIQMYAYFDKTMIGALLDSIEDVAFYSKAQELAKIPLSLIGAISTVMLPYMSNLFNNQRNDIFKDTLNKNLQLIMFISIGASFGIAGIASSIIPWLLGSEFQKSINLLVIMSVLTFIISVSNLIGKQYLLPVNRLKSYTTSVVMGALLNFTLNFILITKIGVVGACISTVVAELFVSGVQLFCARKIIYWNKFLSYGLKYLLAGLIMLFVVLRIEHISSIGVVCTFIQVIAGGFTYLLCLVIFKDSIVLSVISGICNKLKK